MSKTMRLVRHVPGHAAARTGMVAVAVSAVIAAGGPAFAAGTPEPDLIRVTDGPGTHWAADSLGLEPGSQVVKYLDVVVEHDTAMRLTGKLTGAGQLAEGGGLTVKVEEHPAGWGPKSDGGKARTLVEGNTPLNQAVDLGAKVLPAKGVQHLKLTFTVPDNLPDTLQPTQARVTLWESGTAVNDSGNSHDTETGTETGLLPKTGADVWALAVLAAGGILAGTAMAVARRRRHSQDAPPAVQ
ncbi:LPXTG cell wall anchor domain-containing protein [Streptomyces olivoreticuli]